MVIIKTSATDVSIHAVSPELGVHFSRILPPQAGGPASSASAISPNSTQRSAIAKRATAKGTSLRRAYVTSPIVFLLVATDVGEGLPSHFVDLSQANANGSRHQRDAETAAAALSGSQSALNGGYEMPVRVERR